MHTVDDEMKAYALPKEKVAGGTCQSFKSVTLFVTFDKPCEK